MSIDHYLMIAFEFIWNVKSLVLLDVHKCAEVKIGSQIISECVGIPKYFNLWQMPRL